jgi:Spy/CpxP family protein refolding chaperone
MEPNDPGHVLAMKNELQLTNEQVNKLEKILAHARQLTEKVLTKEQKKKLQSLGPGPGMGPHRGPPPGFNPGGNGGPPPGFNPGGNGGPPPGFNPGAGRGAP